jgi:DNA (cytosine-5)-methyltransferase 1
MTHGSLFSGIGGFDLAAEWMGWENVFHCEWNEFGKKVLHHYWPQSISYHDITKTDFTIHRGKIDILTGGFPCQPYSSAGKRKGKEDDRHLWPQMLRAIREIQPRWVVGENVLGLVNWSGGLVFHEVQADLEAQGYEVWPYVLPAAGVGSCPHRRDRVWFVAYCSSIKPRKQTERERGESIERRSTNNGRSSSERTISTPNTSSDGFNAESGRANNTIGQNNKQSRTQRKRTIEGLSNEWPTAHPNGNGLNQRNGNDEEQPGEGGEYALSNADTGNEYGDVADTSHTGLQRSKVNGSIRGSRKESDKFASECVRSNWQNFPTQSPICSRDDGLSSRLDGITFSKWRNESIKAAGNAIVPQVVYQIFKAIQQYETTPPLENTL